VAEDRAQSSAAASSGSGPPGPTGGRRARGWAFVVGAFTAVLALAYWFYGAQLDRRTADLHDQYARSVAHVGRQLELKYGTYERVVATLTTIARAGPLAPPGGRFADLLPSYRDEGGDLSKCEQRGRDAGLCMARLIATASQATAKTRGLTLERCPDFVTPGGAPLVVVDEAVVDGGRPSIVFPPGKRADLMKDVCGRVEIQILDEQSQAFDQLLLLKEDGTVVYESLSSNVRVIAMPGPDPKAPRASRFVSSVDVGPATYEAFFQPIGVRVALPCPGGVGCPAGTAAPAHDGGLVLCGLVRQDRFERERSHVLPTTFLLGAVGLGFSVLLLPLAKLWLIGPRSRFRRYDAALLATAALAATLLCTVLVLAYLANNVLYERLDDQLGSVAAKLSTRLVQEVQDSATALDAFTAKTASLRQALVAGPRAPSRADVEALCPDHRVSGGATDVDTGEASPLVCEATGVTLGEDVIRSESFNLAFWANANGDQQIKYTPHAHAPNPNNIADRGYFKRAMANEIGCLSADARCSQTCGPSPEGGDHRGTPEVVRSYTSGEIVLITARPTGGDPTSGQPDGVAAVEWKLGAFKKPLLPIGFQTAIVDADGTVMLHSDNDAHQGQSVFDDLDSSQQLRPAMASNARAWLDVTYLGVPSRVFVSHLPGPDWYVMTIARRDLVEAPTANMVFITLVSFATLFSLAAFGVGATAIGVRLVRSGSAGRGVAQRSVTMRPNSLETANYARAALWTIGSTCFWCAAAILATPYAPMTVMLLLVVLSAAVGFALLPVGGGGSFLRSMGQRLEAMIASLSKRPRPAAASPAPASRERDVAVEPAKPWWAYFPIAYALCCFGLAGAFVVAPAAVLFSGAYDHSVDGVVRAEQEHYAKQLRYDVGCFDPQASNAGCPSSVFAPDDVTPTTNAPGERPFDSCWFWPMPCLQDALPVITSDCSGAFARLYRAARCSTSEPTERSWLRTTTELDLVPAASTRRLAMTLPRLSRVTKYDFPKLVVLFFAVASLLLVAHVVGYASFRRLLFLDLCARLSRARTIDTTRRIDADGRATSRKVLVLRAPAGMRESLRADGAIDVTEGSPEAPITADTTLFVDLGPLLDRPAQATRVGRLAATPATLVAFADADPVSRAPAESRDAWASALQDFEIEAGPVAVDPRLASGQGGTALFVRLWSASTGDERRVLAQIAIDGHASPHPATKPVLEQLCGRGLLCAATLAIVDPNFADFVRRSASAADLDAWEESDGGTPWQMLRVPLTTGVAALVAILGTNNASPLEFAATGAVVPAIAAALPAVLRVLTSARSSQ
jgi:hypothetical protein